MARWLLTLTITAALLPGAARAHGPLHSVAMVNDPRSHGVLGDSLLSLNEAILLNQRALTILQLSVGEAGQIFGPGPDVGWADINAIQVPRITFERDLSVITDQPHGLFVGGSMGTPVLDLNGTRGIVSTSNFVDFRGLIIENGATGITMTQTDTLFGTTIAGVTFRNLTSHAIHATFAQDNGATRLTVEDCRFESVPIGLEVFDTGNNRTGDLLFKSNEFLGGQDGIAVHLGPAGALNVELKRCVLSGTTRGVVFDRPTASDTRQLSILGRYTQIEGGDVGLSVQGQPGIAELHTLHMMDLDGTTHGLRIWPTNGDQEVLFEDGRLAGGVELESGTSGQGVTLQNVLIRDACLMVGTRGAPLQIANSVFENTTTTTTGSLDLQVTDSCFTGGALNGQPAARILVQNSYLGGTALNSEVSVGGNLPAPQLGSLEVTPLIAPIGTTVTLQADLPPGLAGFWLIGVAETIPVLLSPPLHIYFFLSAYAPVPGVVRNQDSIGVPIPNHPFYRGWDWVAQLAVIPEGPLLAPPLALPPGRMFSTR